MRKLSCLSSIFQLIAKSIKTISQMGKKQFRQVYTCKITCCLSCGGIQISLGYFGQISAYMSNSETFRKPVETVYIGWICAWKPNRKPTASFSQNSFSFDVGMCLAGKLWIWKLDQYSIQQSIWALVGESVGKTIYRQHYVYNKCFHIHTKEILIGFPARYFLCVYCC